ncbi:MAG TPA: hypothetical protein VMB50_06145 [Myxococcales bacterium]|nr:hypothetical protein [Myxococcales bacterium]
MGELSSLLDAIGAMAASVARAATGLPHVAAIALVIVGLIVAALGSRPPIVRVVALVAGAGLGFALAGLPATYFHLPVESVQYALAGGLALLGVAFPEAIVFVVVGGPIGLLGAEFFPPGDRSVAFLPGFLVGGVLGAIFAPWITAVLTGLAGGLAFAMGLARTLPTPVGGGWLLGHPFALVALGLAIGVAGTVTQLSLPTEEQRLAADAEHARKKEARRADRERMKRFREYARKGRQQ